MGVTAGLALFAVGVGTSLLGTAVQANAQIEAGKAAQRRHVFQANVLRNNAKLSLAAAEDTLVQGKVQVQRQQVSTSQFIGSQRASLAAAGVLVDEGSAFDLTIDSAKIGAEEANDIRRNSERLALRQGVNAMNLESDARLAEVTGSQTVDASRRAAAGTILGGLSRASSSSVAFL